MTSINPNQGVNTSYYNQGTSGPQPATYVPGMNNSYRPDQFQQTNPQQGSGIGGLFNSANNKPYVTKQSVMTGLAGAGIGFMLGGPVGALIGGLIGLLLSVIMNVVNIKKAEKSQVPAQPMQIYPNQQQGANAQQQYYQRMQQQQTQQGYQQQQQNGQGTPQQYNPYGR